MPRVEVSIDEVADDGTRRVQGMVTSDRGRTFVVDRNPKWSPAWMCTCGHAPNCSHIAAVRRQIGDNTA